MWYISYCIQCLSITEHTQWCIESSHDARICYNQINCNHTILWCSRNCHLGIWRRLKHCRRPKCQHSYVPSFSHQKWCLDHVLLSGVYNAKLVNKDLGDLVTNLERKDLLFCMSNLTKSDVSLHYAADLRLVGKWGCILVLSTKEAPWHYTPPILEISRNYWGQ